MKRLLLVIPVVLTVSCAEKVDLQKALQLEPRSTGWIDAGVVGGQHKIVPAASFTLKNVSDRPLGAVQVNAVFRQINDPSEWSSAYVPGAARALPPGESTTTLVVRGENGYTSGDPPDAMLKHPQFVNAKVEIYVRSGSSPWIKLVESPVATELQLP